MSTKKILQNEKGQSFIKIILFIIILFVLFLSVPVLVAEQFTCKTNCRSLKERAIDMWDIVLKKK